MTLLLRTLALGGVVSGMTWVTWAAGPEKAWFESEEDQAQTAVEPPAPVAKGKVTAKRRVALQDETSPRNYYKELFHSEESAERTAAPEEAKVSSNQTVKKKYVPKSAPKPAGSKALDELESAARDRQGVVKAEYDESIDSPSESRIQQVRIETRPKSPRVPVPPGRVRPGLSALVNQGLESSPAANTPTGASLASAITLEWVKKSEFNVGQECAVDLVVKNTGTSPVDQVAVDALFQSPVRLTSAKPQPTEHRDRLTWNFDTLPPGSEQRIVLKMIPNRRGDLGLQAQVHVTGTASASFRVEEALLKVALKGPTEIMLGDSASQMVSVSNPGTGAAHDVRLAAKVSSGLEHARGQGETIEMEIGTIMPGESRTVRLPLTGTKGGTQTIALVASTSSDITSEATASVTVVSPSLAVTAEGPALRYKGRNAKFTLSIVNDGTVANNNVRVVQSVGDGFQFVSADHGGKFDPAQKTISWFLGRLEPDQRIQVTCELTATSLGDFTQTVQVASDAGARAEATIDTQVDGAASLTMEIADLDDPIEVGVETAYEIRLKNGGTKAATNVVVSCELPVGVQLLSAKGPTDAAAEGRTLMFKPVSQLSPGQESIFRVHVKGQQDGNHRVKARVSSDSLSEPLLKEEQTKFYSDARR